MLNPGSCKIYGGQWLAIVPRIRISRCVWKLLPYDTRKLLKKIKNKYDVMYSQILLFDLSPLFGHLYPKVNRLNLALANVVNKKVAVGNVGWWRNMIKLLEIAWSMGCMDRRNIWQKKWHFVRDFDIKWANLLSEQIWLLLE